MKLNQSGASEGECEADRFHVVPPQCGLQRDTEGLRRYATTGYRDTIHSYVNTSICIYTRIYSYVYRYTKGGLNSAVNVADVSRGT